VFKTHGVTLRKDAMTNCKAPLNFTIYRLKVLCIGLLDQEIIRFLVSLMSRKFLNLS